MATKITPVEINTARQMLAVFLEQQQWQRSHTVACWLAGRGDLAAEAVCVELQLKMEQPEKALMLLAMLPIRVRKTSRMRGLEARVLYEMGRADLAKDVYLSSLCASTRDTGMLNSEGSSQ